MALFQNPFSLEIPVTVGRLDIVFFINENLFVSNAECISIPHNHHDFELRYIAKGSCRQKINSDVFTASRGDLLLVHPFEYHCQSDSAQAEHSSQYNLRFFIEPPQANSSNALSRRAYETILALLQETRLIHDRATILLAYFERLADEIYRKQTGYVCNVQSLCSIILTEVIRLSGKTCGGMFPAIELKYRGYERTTIDEFFRQQYLTEVTVQDLADSMKVSVRQVNRIMHKLFGMSFTQKLTEMRLWEAAHQIMSTNRPFSAISQNCGFINYNTFFIRFRQKYGMTPSEYRQMSQKNEDGSKQ